MDVDVVIHVDDGLQLGSNLEVQRWNEYLSSQLMMRIVEHLERLNDQCFCSDRATVRTAPWAPGRGKSEAHTRRDRLAAAELFQTKTKMKREIEMRSKKGAWGFRKMGSENLSRNRIYRCSPLRVTDCGLFFCNSSCCECCDGPKRDDW